MISFVSGRFARSAFKEVSYRADALFVGFSFCDLTLSWLISQLSDSVPQIYPRLSGSKTEAAALGGEHVITCVLQELDWFTYLRSGLVGISGSIVVLPHTSAALFLFDLLHVHACDFI